MITNIRMVYLLGRLVGFPLGLPVGLRVGLSATVSAITRFDFNSRYWDHDFSLLHSVDSFRRFPSGAPWMHDNNIRT